MATSVEIFFSYAPHSSRDEKLVEELDKQLSSLKLQGKVTTWGRRDVPPGIDTEKEVAHHLSTARIILLFVSPDFMISKQCQQVEVEQAMRRYEVGEAHVIPIILSSVVWKGTLFDKLQCLPRYGAISEMPRRGQAFFNIAQALSSYVEAASKENPDLHKAFLTVLAPTVPPEQKNASQQIIDMLRQLSLSQRKVNELKCIHNMLHELEQLLNSLTAFLNAKREELLDYRMIEQLFWPQVGLKVDDLLDFARDEMEFIEEKDMPFDLKENQITGPEWATKVFSARKDFAASLDEKASWKVLDDLARKFLDECLQQLFYIDRRLLRAVDILDRLAQQILRSTNHGDSGA